MSVMRLLKRNDEDKFLWAKEHQTAIKKINIYLVKPPVLSLPSL